MKHRQLYSSIVMVVMGKGGSLVYNDHPSALIEPALLASPLKAYLYPPFTHISTITQYFLFMERQ